jgi:hypothetical protein
VLIVNQNAGIDQLKRGRLADCRQGEPPARRCPCGVGGPSDQRRCRGNGQGCGETAPDIALCRPAIWAHPCGGRDRNSRRHAQYAESQRFFAELLFRAFAFGGYARCRHVQFRILGHNECHPRLVAARLARLNAENPKPM